MKRILLAAAILTATTLPAAAQFLPQQQYGWNQQRFGNQTFSYGTGGNYGWSGNSMQFGNQTFSHFSGPGAQFHTCNTMRFGGMTQTNCN